MANDPNKPRPPTSASGSDETSARLVKELRRRGMTDSEIDLALRKKKRRKLLEFNVLKSQHLIDPARSAVIRRRASREPPGRISRELCTVGDAADQLGLHPRTVLRFIREERLAATRVGKSYRIRRADLEAFAGLPSTPAFAAPTVTSIVDIPGVEADLARKWSRTVTAALNARSKGTEPLRADVIHDPQRSHLKLVIVGAPDDGADLLALVRVWLAQLRP